MPCTYYTPGEVEAMTRSDNQRLADQVNDLTKKLCTVLAQVMREANSSTMSRYFTREDWESLSIWYLEHDKKDKERIRKEALNKLTDVEKRALGLT